MKIFEHHNAGSVKDAVSLLKKYKKSAVVIAGGTDLLGLLKDEALPAYPKCVINLKSIPGLDYIKEDKNKGLSIGSMVKLVDIDKSSLIRQKYKVLSEASVAVATPAIRNMGTIGGNLCQDVRCWYYRYPDQIGGRIDCARKGGDQCFAEEGDHRYHAIIGSDGCYAVCPSDTAIALTALNSSIKVVGKGSQRTIPISDLFDTWGNTLKPDEIITEIMVPEPSKDTKQAFLKFTTRKPVDFAVVSVAVLLEVDASHCSDARIVLGAVAPIPMRAKEAEEVLKGEKIGAEVAKAAAEAALENAEPLEKNAYKVEIAKKLIQEAILSSVGA